MSPLPQASDTPPVQSPEPQAPSSVLPGLKRGIAVGVASSVCLILIALLAFFVLRRRKQRKAQQAQGLAPNTKELPAWSQGSSPPALPEKRWTPIPQSPIEADAQDIYELDADPLPVPELPTKIHCPQELNAEDATGDTTKTKRESVARAESIERSPSREIRFSDVPNLQLSLPDMSPLSTASLLATSPLLSPLEEAYLAQSPRSPRSPQQLI